MHHIAPDAAQRIDDRHELHARRADGVHVWPLYPNERRACNDNCNQGRACDCVPAVIDDEDAHDMLPGAGAIVVPAVIGIALICVMLIVHFWRA